jgi:hypothetical protein
VGNAVAASDYGYEWCACDSSSCLLAFADGADPQHQFLGQPHSARVIGGGECSRGFGIELVESEMEQPARRWRSSLVTEHEGALCRLRAWVHGRDLSTVQSPDSNPDIP